MKSTIEAATSTLSTPTTSNDAAVKHLTSLLQENPSELDITILSLGATTTTPPTPPPIYPYRSALVQNGNLGIHAGDLPQLARDVRQSFRAQPTNLDVTACLLLLIPDHATAWAHRRRKLLSSTATPTMELWQNELRFLDLLMTKHTKAPSSWAHRKYVISKILQQNRTDLLVQLVRHEIRNCTLVAERYPKNYYAWTHRIHMLKIANKHYDRSDNSYHTLLQEEWETAEPWLRRHVSDHSAVHYATQVLVLWLDSQQHQQVQLQMVQEAIALGHRLVTRFPTYESLWIFRRLLARIFLATIREHTGAGQEPTRTPLSLFWTDLTDICQQFASERPITVGQGQEEYNQTRIHALSYVLWVLKQMLPTTRVVSDEEFCELRDDTRLKLHNCQQRVVHHLWGTSS